MYAAALMAGSAAGAPIEWSDAEGTRIPIPPPGHPRLYLRAADVAKLPERLADPVLKPAADRLRVMARESEPCRIEWEALGHLADPGRSRGHAIVNETLALMRRTRLADRKDACRATGRMMVTGAIVYDWLFPLLTAADRDAFIAEFIRLAGTLECGYPPRKQGSIAGHSSEAMIMRDLLSAGIAIHDEAPEMYRHAAGRFFREHLPARNWLYDGHAYHQGDSYGPLRFGWDTFPLFIFDRLGAGNVYNPEQRHVPYWYLYTTRPDGQRMRAGDTYMHSTAPGKPWAEHVGALFAASYYGDGVLLGHFLRQGGVRDGEAIFEFLWRDPKLEPRPVDGLPLSRHFGAPFGWTVARTGWGGDAVIAEMKVNEYNFINHQHADAGAFQIWYRGALAIDSGLYHGEGGEYGSDHCRNYYWRTVAHNSLLVHDPAEIFSAKGGYGNDGGQRLPRGRGDARVLADLLDPANGYRTGRVLGQGHGPDAREPEFTLLSGDLTPAYGGKVTDVRRSFVFLNLRGGVVPAALIVFDRVVSTNAAFRKTWLLHTIDEPRLTPAGAVVERDGPGGGGRLMLDVLRPARDNLDLAAVGGPGREYEVGGTNFANDPEPRLARNGTPETGAWRIELAPRRPSTEDLFLTVLQTGRRGEEIRHSVSEVTAEGRLGCALACPDGRRTVLFRLDGRRSGEPVRVRVPGEGTMRLLVADLSPGLWRATPDGGPPREVRVTDALGAAWIEGPPGPWVLQRTDQSP
jgi:heparin/heparan-sulfate lyase